MFRNSGRSQMSSSCLGSLKRLRSDATGAAVIWRLEWLDIQHGTLTGLALMPAVSGNAAGRSAGLPLECLHRASVAWWPQAELARTNLGSHAALLLPHPVGNEKVTRASPDSREGVMGPTSQWEEDQGHIVKENVQSATRVWQVEVWAKGLLGRTAGIGKRDVEGMAGCLV